MHILTFDIEEWFHIHDTNWVSESTWPALDIRVLKNTHLILDFLETNKLKATFYILGWIAEQYPELVINIAESGHEIGYHSWRHLRPFRQQKHEFEHDLEVGIELLSKLTGQTITTYRAPDLTLNNESSWIAECLLAHGIKSSSSTRQGMKINQQRIPGKPFIFRTPSGGMLTEFPVNRYKLPFAKIGYTGSGYFRLLPQTMLRHCFASNEDFIMSYFHPRDFDTALPWDKRLSLLRNWKNTVGSQRTLQKLEYFVKRYNFATVGEAMAQLNVEELMVINL